MSQYFDERTPTDYEPEFFIAAKSETLKFAGNPLKIKIGKLETPFHTLQLKFAGLDALLLDSVDQQQPNAVTPKVQPAMIAHDITIKKNQNSIDNQIEHEITNFKVLSINSKNQQDTLAAATDHQNISEPPIQSQSTIAENRAYASVRDFV